MYPYAEPVDYSAYYESQRQPLYVPAAQPLAMAQPSTGSAAYPGSGGGGYQLSVIGGSPYEDLLKRFVSIFNTGDMSALSGGSRG